jgi:4-amino-4-deoxy-L-arabinose transferase-like glycosyltransferase
VADKISDTPGIALVLALVCVYLAADLAQLSQGLDGVVYAHIARALAAGEGTFWALPFFDTAVGGFSDHPPLGIWLLSLWFELLGDAFWVEKSFSLILLFGLAGLLVGLWRTVAAQRAAWVPLAILFCMPLVTNVLKNYTLDSLVAMTALISVSAAWRSYSQPLWLFVVAVGCLVGLFIKGPVALFPLGAAGCFAVVLHNNWLRAFWQSCVVAAIVVVGIGLVLTNDAAMETMLRYFDNQVIASVVGERPPEHGRGMVFATLARNLAGVVVMLMLAWWVRGSLQCSRVCLCFLLIGLSATIPLLISARQYPHYLFPGLPFFAIAAALALDVPQISWRNHVLWAGAAVLLVVAITRGVVHFGQAGDHEEILADVGVIAAHVDSSAQGSDSAVLGFCAPLFRHQAYLARHHGIRSTVDSNPGISREYLVCGERRSLVGYVNIATLDGNQALWRLRRSQSSKTLPN